MIACALYGFILFYLSVSCLGVGNNNLPYLNSLSGVTWYELHFYRVMTYDIEKQCAVPLSNDMFTNLLFIFNSLEMTRSVVLCAVFCPSSDQLKLLNLLNC